MAITIGEPIRIAAPAVPAVEVWEVKEHARVDANDEDALIERLIAAATQAAENYTGLGIVTQTWQLSLSGFPSGLITLPRRPLVGVTAIDYLDEDGIAQAVDATMLGDASTYTVSGIGLERTFGSIAPATGTSWPSGATQVAVSWAVGFADNAQDLPALIKHAIIVIAATWYGNREDSQPQQIPTSSQMMLSHWRRPAFA